MITLSVSAISIGYALRAFKVAVIKPLLTKLSLDPAIYTAIQISDNYMGKISHIGYKFTENTAS